MKFKIWSCGIAIFFTMTGVVCAQVHPKKCPGNYPNVMGGCIIKTFNVDDNALKLQKEQKGNLSDTYFITTNGGRTSLSTKSCGNSKLKCSKGCPQAGSKLQGATCSVADLPDLKFPKGMDPKDLFHVMFNATPGAVGGVILDPTEMVDILGLSKGSGKAIKELETSINTHLANLWKKEVGTLESNLKDYICQWINKIAKADELYACGNGSSASVNLGTAAPTIKLSNVKMKSNDKKNFKVSLNYSSSWKSSGAEIKATVKCKVKVKVLGIGVGKSDGACPDPHGVVKNLSASVSGSGTVSSTFGGNTKMQDMKVTKTTAGANMQVCFKFFIAGKKCFSLNELLGDLLEKEVGGLIKRGIESI